MSNARAGLFDKLYRNSGTYGSPTLSEVNIIEDAAISDEGNEITGKLRKNSFEAILIGQFKRELTFKLATDPADSNWAALQTAFYARTDVELFFFYKGDSATTGSKALRGTYKITKFPLDQPLEDMDSGEVACKPSLEAAQQPEIYTVP